MPRPEKVATVEEIRNKLESARAAVLTEYRGLKVGELAELRSALRSADAEYKIFKNTLARRAAEEAGLADLAALLDGPTAITFVRGDAVAVARALRDYSRTNPALVVKGGVLGTRVIRSSDVAALADIQPREVLLARIAGGFQAPMTKAAGLFQAFTRNLAYGVKALIDQRVAAGEAPPPPEAGAAEAPAEAAEAPAEAPEVAAETAEVSSEAPEVAAETAEVSAEAPEVAAETAEVSAEAPEVAAETAEVSAEAPAEAPEAPTEAPEAPAEASEAPTEDAASEAAAAPEEPAAPGEQSDPTEP